MGRSSTPLGGLAPSLQPLVTALLGTDRPKSRLIWLRNPNVVRLLRGRADGSIPLTHDGLHQDAPTSSSTSGRSTLGSIAFTAARSSSSEAGSGSGSSAATCSRPASSKTICTFAGSREATSL
ncbi:hypothetical protein [Streptomyces sp. NPDC056821]|uniref:hypothetical protein n=1 Tax=unclassified Streptomyces TaxID=2593676 RepID=UPI00367450B8